MLKAVSTSIWISVKTIAAQIHAVSDDGNRFPCYIPYNKHCIQRRVKERRGLCFGPFLLDVDLNLYQYAVGLNRVKQRHNYD